LAQCVKDVVGDDDDAAQAWHDEHAVVVELRPVGVFGGLVIGSGVGGVLAERWGVTAPFWFAFACSAVFVVLIWRQLAHIAHADEGPVAEG